MCGIAGLWHLDGRPVDREKLVAARDSMRARGPDDCGLYIDGSIGLAHRRLNIIDLSPAGRMPMANEHGDVYGTFNGEIYNFVDLRRELEALGHAFRSRTDSEVAIHAYEQWGMDAFARFDGMFAIAIWDQRQRQLVLARDPMGEKPLYYAHEPGKLVVFGSTLEAVLASGLVPRTTDDESTRAFLQLGFVPAPASIIRGVSKVEPGHHMVIRSSGAAISRAFWRLAKAAVPRRRSPLTLEAATDELQRRMRHAVRSRLVSDVPLGAFLSGGVDSSLVVALMREASATVRTFTIGFADPRFDESTAARRIAQHLGVENTCLVLDPPQVLRELEVLTGALDEPMADYSMLPTLAVSRLAREHVTVALTGDGADELFAGYRYYNGTRAFEYVSLLPEAVRRPLARLSRFVPSPRVQRALARTSEPDAAAYFARSGFYRGATADSAPRILEGGHGPWGVHRIADEVRAFSTLTPTEAGLVWDATHTLPDAWLTKVDRASMAFALETRAPFLNRDVVEFAFGLPLAHRLRGAQRKIVLRRLLGRYVPTELYERPKQGFTAPLKTWFANELKAELHDRLAAPRMRRLGVVSPTSVADILVEQERGKHDHTQLLWALFMLDRWYERNIDGAT